MDFFGAGVDGVAGYYVYAIEKSAKNSDCAIGRAGIGDGGGIGQSD